jgi:hypothetical protein
VGEIAEWRRRRRRRYRELDLEDSDRGYEQQQ